MILLLDNYDSFVYNLARYIEQLGHTTQVIRADKITLNQIKQLSPHAIIISPGPGKPIDAGISLATISELGSQIPILGVCLGHQAIGQAFGGAIVKSQYPMHGKARSILHKQDGIFKNLASPLMAACYHSLIVATENFPDELMITSLSAQGEIMALQHRVYPIYGVQFHPESILTECGYQLLENFFKLIDCMGDRKSPPC